MGNTTPTDSRSQRIRAGRRGGQLLTRARGSWYETGLPTVCVLPVPLSRMVSPYATAGALAWARGTGFIMPDTNPIESTFATVRLRTDKTRGCLSRTTALSMVFKLCRSAEKRWRRLQGAKHLAEVIEGVPFQDGLKVNREAA